MTGKVLVVDDVPANVKLLSEKLGAEYYEVITADSGKEALAAAAEHRPDVILLDVMMPEMDGFETCRALKADTRLSDIPVVMVTALSDAADRVRGLEAGADDFLTKPINDTALFTRVRSLIRIKTLLDELRLRDSTQAEFGGSGAAEALTADVTGARVALLDDDPVQVKHICVRLQEAGYIIDAVDAGPEVLKNIKLHSYETMMISTLLTDEDGLRFASLLKAVDVMRHVPFILLVDENDTAIMNKVLEMGFHDYLRTPIDKNEMVARVRTQVRRYRYQSALRNQYVQSMHMAVKDGLTGLYNRHYLDKHLENVVRQAEAGHRPLSLMMMDMDHFKRINDQHGHDSGDKALKQLASIIMSETRSTDLAARYGGEEFVMLMPDAPQEAARDVAERLRAHVEREPFIMTDGTALSCTISLGVSTYRKGEDSAATLLKRADEALYKAKHEGRNRVVLG